MKVIRPKMQDYGIHESREGMLTWDFVDEQMAQSRNYWIGTTRPDGRPHAAPVWGVWLDGHLYFGTSPNARKARNLDNNPALVVHLESGDDVVILEGTAVKLTEMPPNLYETFSTAYAAKYAGFKPNAPSENEPIYTLRIQTAMAWQEKNFPQSATRWEFD
ncbi:MAG: pyridoxamine 5'-phosphate oxidase family protein [Ardenticatenaceae bacterium]|nr:pyridoxamine 5'-phosphate oxidase family protein [Ardenticatenaceae bacterium]MCB9444206.1 pyridoxamine 5'-phosphate oxidase family protein [Ardenticatenaceae bacterium]